MRRIQINCLTLSKYFYSANKANFLSYNFKSLHKIFKQSAYKNNLFSRSFSGNSVSPFRSPHFSQTTTKSALTMDSGRAMIVSTKVELTEREKQLFDFLLDYINAKEVKVIPRSAGGWVRDKVTFLFNSNRSFQKQNL